MRLPAYPHLAKSNGTRRTPCRKIAHVLTCAVLSVAPLVASSEAVAATNGVFVQADGLLSIGPGRLSAANSKLGGGDGHTLYGLANDGRFGFGAAVGYIHDRTGIRVRYLYLGTQPTLSINGKTTGSRGGLTSHFMGVEGLYLVPLIPRRVDLVLSGGAGVLRSSVPFPGASHPNAEKAPRPGKATQFEPALSLGVGLRVALLRQITGNIDITRLTPFQSGLRSRGLYNNGQTVISAGIAYTF
ncbi:hypothetical protein WM40_18105 [Robbsia andropogonis]|uniref:Outer membrane protein beta-barrel domain-containing protein n=1 Tax=Robbsia andropogonis TaxID=28092 RepID=A0A0F5JX72_9BURK|nr:hypothetical protein [Robbsia andropogonis]KKB62224.1 hypothetical protein WM40_18105 [Robbsia andropogonis]MCP1121373.1 hypothetical protein [Robbsia andropogonis]MCP1131192.1 hypothetical protein [Robbsia andropogonis]